MPHKKTTTNESAARHADSEKQARSATTNKSRKTGAGGGKSRGHGG